MEDCKKTVSPDQSWTSPFSFSEKNLSHLWLNSSAHGSSVKWNSSFSLSKKSSGVAHWSVLLLNITCVFIQVSLPFYMNPCSSHRSIRRLCSRLLRPGWVDHSQHSKEVVQAVCSVLHPRLQSHGLDHQFLEPTKPPSFFCFCFARYIRQTGLFKAAFRSSSVIFPGWMRTTAVSRPSTLYSAS